MHRGAFVWFRFAPPPPISVLPSLFPRVFVSRQDSSFRRSCLELVIRRYRLVCLFLLLFISTFPARPPIRRHAARNCPRNENLRVAKRTRECGYRRLPVSGSHGWSLPYESPPRASFEGSRSNIRPTEIMKIERKLERRGIFEITKGGGRKSRNSVKTSRACFQTTNFTIRQTRPIKSNPGKDALVTEDGPINATKLNFSVLIYFSATQSR